MNTKVRNILIALCVATFAFMSLASGSSSEEASYTQVVVQQENGEGASSTENNIEVTPQTQSVMQYEVSDTRFEYYTNSIGSTEYFGIVEITNTGDTNIYLDDCTFDLEDNDGHLLQSDSFISAAPEIIAPGERGYFYNGIGSNLINENVSFDNGIVLVPQIRVEEATGEPVDYPVSDVTVSEGNYGYLNVLGRVENTSDEEIGYLYVDIVFYDANGTALAITGTSVTNIPAGGMSSFDTTCYFANENVSISDIADTVVMAREHYYQW
ncbi:MAG: FxLYD domain-containing protein [Saccharofermentans sp.]|nr:FxLYD domain-containing protein [Saccharofermentans sp.]